MGRLGTKYNNKVRSMLNKTIRGEGAFLEEGDWVLLHLRKDHFPQQRKSKLNP